MKALLLLLLTLASCQVGISAAASLPIPIPEAYCEPIFEDVYLCRDDAERTWRCVANEYGWSCRPAVTQ